MKTQNIKIFEPGTKPNKYKLSTKEHPLINEIATSEVMFLNRDANSETMLTNYLRSNPFLYNPDNSKVVVDTIEDFIIKAKKEEVAFGDTLRNPKYTPKQRKRFIKKAFKIWKHEYNEKKNKTFKENDKVIEVIGEASYMEYTWKTKIFLFITFVSLLFLVITDSIVWNALKQGTFGYSIYKSITVMYENMHWLKIVGNIGIYICLILIFYSTIYSFIIKDFRKNYKLAQSFLTNSEVSISRDFNKKYKKARKYYLKRVDDRKYPFFPPLDIKEVQEGKINIRIFNEICSVTIDRAYIMKKSKPYITAFNSILKFSGYACAIVIVGLSLYSIIQSFFS